MNINNQLGKGSLVYKFMKRQQLSLDFFINGKKGFEYFLR